MGTKHKLFILAVILVVTAALIIIALSKRDSFTEQNSMRYPIFLEEFSGKELSTKWEVVRNWNGTINVSDGLLELAGGTHKRVNSTFEIYHSNSTLTLTGRVKLTGYYQKFGFNINAENIHNGTGIYFDTFCPQNDSCSDASGTLAQGEDKIYLTVREKNINLFEANAKITYREFHQLKIVVSPNDIDFLIDDVAVGRTIYRFTGPMTVGIWNDRSSEMQVDWIRIEQGG